MTDRLPYPPPYQDIATLAAHLCITPETVETWVERGKLPPPKVKGDGKRLWKWSEVVKTLEAPSLVPTAEGITNATRRAAAAGR